jgi:hypothetical protein
MIIYAKDEAQTRRGIWLASRQRGIWMNQIHIRTNKFLSLCRYESTVEQSLKELLSTPYNKKYLFVSPHLCNSKVCLTGSSSRMGDLTRSFPKGRASENTLENLQLVCGVHCGNYLGILGENCGLKIRRCRS